MGRYTVGRLAQLGPVLLLVALLIFAILHLLPGDPVALMLQGAEGGAITPERLDSLRREMGLNDPLPLQFVRFVGHAVLGDLGQSVRFRSSVTGLILDRFPSTLALSVAGLAWAVAIGLPVGVLAAVRRNSWIDSLSVAGATLGVSMPVFWLGLLLILLFSFTLHWLPSAGAGSWRSLILPSLSLGFIAAGTISRLVRSSLIEVLGEDYIRTARAKGLSERLMIWRHALKNALIPVVTMLGLQFGGMLAGAVVTETVFSRPGLGRLVVSAILDKDYALVQGAVLFIAVVYLAVNFAADLAYVWLDPRIHYRRQAA